MVGSMLIGRFRIGNRLGAGTFGETFLAQDTQKMNAQCVVKRLIPPDDPAHIGIVREMFDKEAKKLDALSHQGIPKLIAYFENGGDFYLVQDFVDGNTLDKEINRSRKWTEAEVNNFLLEVLEVLAYVHSQGSIHRDLKPNNMMRRKVNKKLVLIDFGAVREVRQNTTNMAIGLASGTIAIGTLGYMPAEQAQGRPCYASDVYAIGCMAIEALIGVSPYPPYGFDTDVNTGEFRWRHRAQVSDGLAALIDKMVRYDWRQRYVNGGAALDALQGLASNHARNVPNPLSVNPVPHNSPANRLQTQTLNNIITVDLNGKEINRRSVQVQYFVEDKISLPSGAKAIEMALIPKGSFEMGMPASERQVILENAAKKGAKSSKGGESFLDSSTPTRIINFAQPFYISRYEVTQKQWFTVMGNDYDQDGFKKRFGELDNQFKGDNRPMVAVRWNDAKAYCAKLSELTGRSYRLPTESEWEYSCRAKTTTPYHFGETITSDLVNYMTDLLYGNVTKYPKVTTDVGRFPPNAWGLYDMHGNVTEWCEDLWHDNYYGIPQDGSAWLSDGDQNRRIHRGGCWGDYELACRAAIRMPWSLGHANFCHGFRVAASVL